MNFIYKILLVTALAVSCSAQEGRECHTSIITPAHFFNMTDYARDNTLWYMNRFSVGDGEAEVTPNYKCLSVNYTATSNPLNYLTVETYTLQVNGSSTIVEENSLVSIANLMLPAYWKIYSNAGAVETDSVILHTDYVSWSIAYTCQMRGTYRHESATVWTRDRIIDDRLSSFMRTLLIGYGFPPERHFHIDQTNC